jgi:hypothetical protein
MEKYREDINYMLKKLEAMHPALYYYVSKESLSKYIGELMRENISDEYKFRNIIDRILKKINDNHTKRLEDNDISLPIIVEKFDDSFYIVDTIKELSQYFGYKVNSINDIPIERVANELEKIAIYSTDGWRDYLIENMLTSVTYLLSLPLFESNLKNIEFEIEYNGISKRISFSTKKDYSKEISKIQGFRFKKDNYVFEVDKEKKIIILTYSECIESYENQMRNFINQVQETAMLEGITDYIVDLRGNFGGNSNVVKPLVSYLENNSSNIVTIVDKRVFSSGRLAIEDLENIGSTIIGTGIGTTTNQFGNGTIFYLPNSNFCIFGSAMFYYFDDDEQKILRISSKEEFDKFISKKENRKYLLPDIYEPDFYVYNTIEDIRVRYDRQLETAKNIINEKRLESCVKVK